MMKNSMRALLAFWLPLCVACMVVMLVFAANKTIVIADGYKDQDVRSETANKVNNGTVLTLVLDASADETISIPLPDGRKAENVTVENHYMESELWIYVEGGKAFWYGEKEITGDISCVEAAWAEDDADGVWLKFKTNAVMEYRNVMKQNSLQVSYYEPHALYDWTIVLDAQDNGLSGKNVHEADLTLQVAKLVQNAYTGSQVRIYLTRADDKEPTKEEKQILADAVDADFYIGLSASYEEENVEMYGINASYNASYFIPDFGNVEFADTLARNAAIASNNRANGLYAVESESVLTELTTRGAILSLGFLSNKEEEQLLSQEGYIQKLADGIVKAIEESVESLLSNETD